MFTPLRRTWAVALALAALLTVRPALRAQAPGEPPPVPTENEINPPPTPDGAVVPQQSGPVHEAFAVPADRGPAVGPVAPRQPPAPVPEVPPDQRPEGGNVIWVPGYWSWDVGRNDFLWVSGCWRVPPPGRKWVPGSWAQADGRWQWAHGLWAPAGQAQPSYLPPPPDSLDNGPSTPAPDDNSFYVPGSWLYQDTGYAWRPGCWSPYRPGWVWSPASYCATPSGYVFVNGYWDYPLDNRGLLFAPVCFNGTPWTTPGWCYRPNYCVGLGGLLSSLWVGPSRGGYYFGNYAGSRYRGLGFTPWYAGGRGHANPLFGYYRWANRGNAGWYRGIANAYRGGAAGARASLVRPLGRLAGSHAPRLARVSPAQINRQRAATLAHRAAPRQFAQSPARHAPAVRPAAAPRVARLPSRPAFAPPRRPAAAAPRFAGGARPRPQAAPRPAPHLTRPAPPVPHRAAPAPRPAPHVARSAPHPAPHPAPGGHGGHHR